MHGGPIDLAACVELCGAGFRATVTVTVRPMLRDRCPVCLFVTLQVYCGQTVGRIKMPLGTEVVLGPGYIVLDGDPAPPKEVGTAAPTFVPCQLWPNGRPSQLLMSSC